MEQKDGNTDGQKTSTQQSEPGPTDNLDPEAISDAEQTIEPLWQGLRYSAVPAADGLQPLRPPYVP